ncbi:MAG TPA: hypothetical protein VEH06_11670 [Candidatus Bathyarchaeia archaeon]|nr:hypothetical protein [Candidatus Bathyarchaeia archaeon]
MLLIIEWHITTTKGLKLYLLYYKLSNLRSFISKNNTAPAGIKRGKRSSKKETSSGDK